jgi:hypothetical protein
MEELRMLSNFQLGDRALLQSFLVGQPELRDLLRGPSLQQLRQRVIASYHLGPMDEDETRGYIEHRLRRVGWKDDPSFEPAVFAVIHRATGGIPRKINLLCNRLLLAGYLAEKHAIGKGDVDTVVGEIRAEGGVDAPPPPPAPAMPEEAARADNVVRPFAISALAARLDRIEKSINTMHELLRSIAGSPDRRPRSGGRPK